MWIDDDDLVEEQMAEATLICCPACCCAGKSTSAAERAHNPAPSICQAVGCCPSFCSLPPSPPIGKLYYCATSQSPTFCMRTANSAVDRRGTSFVQQHHLFLRAKAFLGRHRLGCGLLLVLRLAIQTVPVAIGGLCGLRGNHRNWLFLHVFVTADAFCICRLPLAILKYCANFG